MQPLLIGYDGSGDAQEAVRVAGSLFAGRQAVILTVWRPLVATLARYPMAGAAPLSNVEEIDRDLRARAEKTAEEGVEQARAAGLEPSAATIESEGAVWHDILTAADEHEAFMIVVGPRGLTGLKSALLGSVSQGLLQHSHRPVLVVPHAGE
jgi:nucleotide-binding universal stress UspA family protein